MGSGGWLLSDVECAGMGGGAWRERERDGCERSFMCLRLHDRRRARVRDKRSEREVKKDTTVISSVYSFMPPSSLWGIHVDMWLQI